MSKNHRNLATTYLNINGMCSKYHHNCTTTAIEYHTNRKLRFDTGIVPSCQAVLTTVCSVSQKMELLFQIATASIPSYKNKFSYIKYHMTITFGISFYFPSIGTFRHYPLTISKRGTIIGDANIYRNEIVVKYPNKLKKLDVESWKEVALNSNSTQLTECFNSNNVCEIDWGLIYHRLKNASIFELIYNLLNERGVFNQWNWNQDCCHFTRVSAIKAKELKQQQQNTMID